ncbi:MAG TPA: hypothetical protein VFR86_15635 [Burkholderiaceae bacterium]|nr:hypothetical protein [Burkholderiaceae bacterium]
MLAETRSTDAAARARLRAAITRAVLDALGEPPDEIVLAPPHTVLKTSSGKIRRSACRALYEQRRVGAPLPTARRQFVQLALGALAARLRHAGTLAARRLDRSHAQRFAVKRRAGGESVCARDRGCPHRGRLPLAA